MKGAEPDLLSEYLSRYPKAVELAGIFSFDQVITHQGAEVQSGDTLSVSTPPQLWAFAASLPLQQPSAHVSDPGASPVVVEVLCRAISGRCGLGCLNQEQTDFAAEAKTSSRAGLQILLLRLGNMASCHSLVVRNLSETGEPSQIIIHSIRAFKHEPPYRRSTYIFDHLFKTGGTTFHQSYLPHAFPADERFVAEGHLQENIADIKRLSSFTPERQAALRAIAGHNLESLRPYFPSAKYLTLVRQPRQRVVSAFLHARSHPDSKDVIGKFMQQNKVTLSDFVRQDLFAERYAPFVSVRNWQARTVLGSQFQLSCMPGKAEVLEAIRSRYYLVGYTEALEMFLFSLHLTDGFPLLLFNNRLVRGATDRYEPTPEDLVVIDGVSQIDSLIYEVAKEEFDRRMALLWNARTEAYFKEYLAALENFCRDTNNDINAAMVFRY